MTNPARLVHPARLRTSPEAVGARSVGLGYGGDYNPEQWPEQLWAEDAALMVEAGVSFVTVGVFSWARIEPRPGVRDLAWLERVLNLMHDHGIAVDLATATASPPPWLTTLHPEVLPVDRAGNRTSHGSRQGWCPSSPVFRKHALALVEDVAAHFADHPALVLWHVSNELGCHNAHCYCDVSAAAFRRWLQRRYASLGGLNAAWGTTFWSQHYGTWDEVQPPRLTLANPNPTQELDFRRFSSEELLDHHRAERDILRRVAPEVPVTTNFMVSSHIDALDYWRWAPEQDVISNDHYLDGRVADPHIELALAAEWTSGLAGGRPWVLMEHSTSAVNWQPRNYAKAAGQMRRNSLQHVARGADSVGFFQWRASAAGAEKYHSAMLPHAGTDSRVWREVVQLGADLARLGEITGTVPVAEVAMILDYESWWAVERSSLPSGDVTYLDRVRALHQALWEKGVSVAVRRATDDLSGYRLVVAPTWHLVSEESARAVEAYVTAGGHLLATYFSGIVDQDDHIPPGAYPGMLRDLLRIRVHEFVPLPPGTSVSLDWTSGSTADGGDLAAGTWVEDLHCQGAEPRLVYRDGPLPGAPALTRARSGDGVAWYLATRTTPAATSAVLDQVLDDAGVTSLGLPAGVELARRRGDGRSYLFVINHTDKRVTVPADGTDLLGGTSDASGMQVAPGGVAVVRETGP